MSTGDKNDWTRKSDEFYERTNFVNCIVTVHSKHIRMRKPNEIGSQFFNYKNFFSGKLNSVENADFCFISLEVGSCGLSSKSMVI